MNKESIVKTLDNEAAGIVLGSDAGYTDVELYHSQGVRFRIATHLLTETTADEAAHIAHKGDFENASDVNVDACGQVWVHHHDEDEEDY